MADKNTSKKNIINIELPASIDNAAKNLTDKPTQTIGTTISDCLYLVFGNLSQKAELKRLKYAHELKQFKQELEDSISNIPKEKLLEPNTHTICTALDNMRYCVEEKHLRDMFSSLISNSIHADKHHFVHPSFGEIIKQLTSFDAVLFKDIMQQPIHPIISINVTAKNSTGTQPLMKNLIWSDFNCLEKVTPSLDNLMRLKLINITYTTSYTNKEIYKALKQTPHIVKHIQQYETIYNHPQKLSFSEGIIEITDYGKNFFNACS